MSGSRLGPAEDPPHHDRKKATHAEDAPTAMKSEYRLREILVASALRGAIVAVVKALVSRGGARGFTKLTGSWPGD